MSEKTQIFSENSSKGKLILILKRFGQPSSWAGFGIIATAFISAEEWGYLLSIGTGVAGILAFLLDERKQK